jgi:hypothetical protein
VCVCGGGSAEETEACACDSTADLIKNLLKDHSRHCVPGVGGHDGLTGNELSTSEEIGMELRRCRLKNGSKNGEKISRIAP